MALRPQIYGRVLNSRRENLVEKGCRFQGKEFLCHCKVDEESNISNLIKLCSATHVSMLLFLRRCSTMLLCRSYMKPFAQSLN